MYKGKGKNNVFHLIVILPRHFLSQSKPEEHVIPVHQTMALNAYCTYSICFPPRGNNSRGHGEISAGEATLLWRSQIQVGVVPHG